MYGERRRDGIRGTVRCRWPHRGVKSTLNGRPLAGTRAALRTPLTCWGAALYQHDISLIAESGQPDIRLAVRLLAGLNQGEFRPSSTGVQLAISMMATRTLRAITPNRRAARRARLQLPATADWNEHDSVHPRRAPAMLAGSGVGTGAFYPLAMASSTSA